MESVVLLGIEINNKLSFEKYVSTICRKAKNQLNAISRTGIVLRQQVQFISINSFAYSTFDYCPLICHFTTCKGIKKVGKVQERCLKFYIE